MKPYYEDESVTLYLGDCREILPTLDAQSFDLLVTDPPYGIAYKSNWARHDVMAGDDGQLDVGTVLAQALTRLRIGRHFYVFGPADMSALTKGATTELIWDEGKHGMGNLSLPWGVSHERITFGVWNPYPSMANVGALAARLRRGSVLRSATVNNGRGALLHPTEKPVALIRELIEASSRIGETVLDPFAGAGSTLIAAVAEGRNAVGVEIEERYCEVIATRLGRSDLFGGAV